MLARVTCKSDDEIKSLITGLYITQLSMAFNVTVKVNVLLGA